MEKEEKKKQESGEDECFTEFEFQLLANEKGLEEEKQKDAEGESEGQER
jgi:hypothetical protein